MNIKRAVCAVVILAEGQILTVTRRHSEDLCLPGGKVDSTDGSDADALCRELLEETGCIFEPSLFIPVYGEIIPSNGDGNDFFCTAYVYSARNHLHEDTPDVWVVEEGIKVRFTTIQELLDGVFSEYNKKVLQEIQLKVPGFADIPIFG